MVPLSTCDYTSPAWSIDGSAEEIVGYQTDTMGDLGSDFIADRAAEPSPFFLYTAIVGPHAGSPVEPADPAFPTPNVAARYQDVFAGRANTDASFNEADVTDKPLQPEPLSQTEIAGLTEVNAQRKEAMLSVQDAVVRIVATLRATGELDNTYWRVAVVPDAVDLGIMGHAESGADADGDR